MIEYPPNSGRFIAVVSAAWRDAIRGYSDADVVRAREKMAGAKSRGPGGITYLTRKELRAITSERIGAITA